MPQHAHLSIKTRGGNQFWTDHLYRRGYRIQQHALTGHFRLLDQDNVQRQFGAFEPCATTLDRYAPASDEVKENEVESESQVAVLLHGLMRTRRCMLGLENELLREHGLPSYRFTYASTRSSIAKHAMALRQVLEGFSDHTRFSFIGHSLGNIVVRRLLGDLEQHDPKGILGRCRSMVMLGPPNQGALIARRLAKTGLFGLITGQSGMELGPKWSEFCSSLAIPKFPFLIIAGDFSQRLIRNPIVGRMSDLIVTLDEVKLPGAAKLLTFPVAHAYLMTDPRVIRSAASFLAEH